MSDHTPGPWAWRKNGNSLLLWGEHGMRPIVLDTGRVAGVASGKTVLRMRDAARDLMVEATAEHPDALLIVAAPDLLAACKEALEEITVSIIGRAADPIIRRLDSVIAKAEGREPRWK